jgi:hypothetical protein
MMAVVAVESWDPVEWEVHGIAMITHHFGVDQVVPVPDDDGGDRGLDAFTVKGIGYQCYAPEGEPLAPSKRASLQKGKITTDLKKLLENSDKLQALLGSVELHTWVLLSPEHKSASVIEHCNIKAKEVLGWNLPFVAPDFRVLIHSTATYLKAHAFIMQTEAFSGDLQRPPEPVPGADFGAVTGPLIDVMNTKLRKIPRLREEAIRRKHRANLLEGHLGGGALLDRIRDRAPDLAAHFDAMMEAARRDMIFTAAGDFAVAEFYIDLRKRLVERFSADLLPVVNAEFLADKCITDWLQQCPLDFEEAV